MKLIITLLLLVLINSVGYSFDKPNEDIIFAMKNELNRSMNELKINDLESPYFIEYKYVEYDASSMRGSMGSIEAANNSKSAYISVSVRVGDYSFDNTNFFDVGLGFFGSSDDEEGFKKRAVSYEPSINYLRKEFWLATDAAYKQTAELYSKKLAILKNRMRKDTIPDFNKLESVKKLRDIKEIPEFNLAKYKAIIESVSSVFKIYPAIYTSGVSVEFIPQRIYYMNSEGVEYIKDSYYTGFEIVAASQNKEGMPVFDHYTAYSIKPSDMPIKDSLIKAAKLVAENISDRLRIPQLDDFYVGPIIFSGQAAGQIFAQSFLPKLISQREPLTDGGFSSENEDAVFQRKVGGRVLPEFLNITDKPNESKLNGVDLIGTYKIDDDGLESQNVELVKGGYLETLLSDRVPTKRIKESNAHKRGGSAMFSNIIVENNNSDNKLSSKELESKLLEFVKKRELDFGIVVTKILDANIRYTSLYRILNGNIEIPFGKKNYVMDGYKVYTDGRKEKFSGMVIPTMNVLLFKDIVSTSDKSYTLNYLAPAVISPYLTGGDSYLPSSITLPDLLFEDAELHLMEEDFKRPPYVNNN
ncbi:MAG: metallopeptidase TldD-related protein [Candidatus Kapaibacterium sp.]